jgi:hypothetical protein
MDCRSLVLLLSTGGRAPGTGAAERHALRTARCQQVAIEEGQFQREQSERASATGWRYSCRKFFFSRESRFRQDSGFHWTFNCRAGDAKFD